MKHPLVEYQRVLVEYHGPLWTVLVESGWITMEVIVDYGSNARMAIMEKLS